jgi:hypothetical protein
MLTTFLHLNFLGCPVYKPCSVVGYPTLIMGTISHT